MADASSAVGGSVSAERKSGCRVATTVAFTGEAATKSVGDWQRSVPSGRGVGTCCRWHWQVLGQRQGEPSKARRIGPVRFIAQDLADDRQQPQQRFLLLTLPPAASPAVSAA